MFPTPYTLHPTPYTLDSKPQIVFPTPYTTAWAACLHDDRYRQLFAGADTLEPTAGNIVTTFLATYFTGE